MREGHDRNREERLLQAIGNLPEDMVARAAEYKRPKRKAYSFAWRGLAAAACLALVFLGGMKVTSLLREFQASGEKYQMAEQAAKSAKSQEESGADMESSGEDASGMDDEVKEGMVSGEKSMDGVQLWAGGAVALGNGKDAKDEDLKSGETSKKSNSAAARSDVMGKAAQAQMEEGKTIALQTTKEKDSDGEDFQVITVGFAETEGDVTYSLHSQASNCKIVTVSHEGMIKSVNLPDAECMDGDEVKLDTRQYACVDWAYNFMPDWEEIEIIDIIDIARKEEKGEEHKVGRIVIGRSILSEKERKAGEEMKFYGVYQNKNDGE